MKRFFIFAVLAALLLVAGWHYNKKTDEQKQAEDTASLAAEQEAAQQAQTKAMESLQKEDLVVGTGTEAKTGDTVSVNYVGTFDDGEKFDSSYDRNQPFEFKLGAGQVIQGWDLGVLGMKVGGKRKLTIPSELAYGANGASGVIPPNATLHFEIELLGVK